jgi:hypothetical protein
MECWGRGFESHSKHVWVCVFSVSVVLCVGRALTQSKKSVLPTVHSSNKLNFICHVEERRPPLWSSDQSSWLQIQRSGFDSRHYQIFRKIVGLERGALSLVSTTEKLLQRKHSGSGLESRDYGRRGFAALTTLHSSIRKSWH